MEQGMYKRINITIFIVLTVIFPVMDSLNGFFLTNHIPIPIGMIYRFCYFFFILSSIIIGRFGKHIYTLLTLLCLLGCLLLILLQTIVLQNSFTLLISDLIMMVKFTLWLLIPYYIYQRRAIFLSINLDRLFLVISLLLVLGLLIPYLLGIGNYTYASSNAGYKAFYFATNDITIAFMVAITFTGWQLVRKLIDRKWIKAILLIFLYFGELVSLLLISTKTGIAYGMIYSIILFFYFLFVNRELAFFNRLFMAITFVIVVVYLIMISQSFIVEAVNGTYMRIHYFYHLYNGNLIRLITSSRSEYLQLGFQTFLDPHHPLAIFFIGFGFKYRLLHFGGAGVGGLMEMDFFDTLFALGSIGALLVTAMVLYYLYLALRKSGYSIYTFALIIILFYSFFAGHVMFSALCTTLLGLVCGGVLLTNEKNQKGVIHGKQPAANVDR